jgi:hypothetical protein
MRMHVETTSKNKRHGQARHQLNWTHHFASQLSR